MRIDRPENAVVLITTLGSDAPSQGTGVCISGDSECCWILTCGHVVKGQRLRDLRVNAHPVLEVRDGLPHGLDLALLKVTGLGPLTQLIDSRRKTTEKSAQYFGYSRLFRTDYIRERIDVVLGDEPMLQNSAAKAGVYARRFTVASDRSIGAGHSGSPIVDEDGGIIGIVVYRLESLDEAPDEGLAISLPRAVRLWPELGQMLGVDAGTESAPPKPKARKKVRRPRFRLPDPPFPAKPVDHEDLNAGRFGGKSQINGHKLTPELDISAVSQGVFVFDAVLETNQNVEGPVKFYLHSSFDPSTFVVSAFADDIGPPGKRRFTLREVVSYGVFTVGCQFIDQDGEPVRLEYNLKDLPALPPRFRSR